MKDTACAACGAETLLFECSRCGRAYCADHERPHHACPASSGATDLAAAGFVPLAAAADADEVTTEATETGPEDEDENQDQDQSTRATAGGMAEAVSFGVNDRDAARETRPDSERQWPVPDARGSPAERDESLVEWFQRQSLIGYTLKIGTLVLLFYGAILAGLAAVLYGFV